MESAKPKFSVSPLFVALADIRKPRFTIGSPGGWDSEQNQDFGLIAGVECAPAEHRQNGWGWRYLVWLDPNSPSMDQLPQGYHPLPTESVPESLIHRMLTQYSEQRSRHTPRRPHWHWHDAAHTN